MYLYAYYIRVCDNDSRSTIGYTGLTCADNYSEAYHNISSIYEGPDACIIHLELDEFDAFAPCIELPARIVQNIIDNNGEYKDDTDG